MTHPLTDEMCETLSRQPWLGFDSPVEGTIHDMRASADWQLDQVIEQWEEICNSNRSDDQVIREFDKRLKAMRPQQQQQEESSIKFILDQDEIVRIDDQGFHYRGQFVEDAGQAHRLLVNFLQQQQEER